MNIINVGYDSTNYYILSDSRPQLLIDVGWPGTLPKLQHQCKRTNIRLQDLKYMLLTHYHPDHAGLAQELKRTGIKLIVLEHQIPFIPALKTHMKPENHYVEIDLSDNVTFRLDESRAFLARLGIEGEVISTPGHSEDSVSLVLDRGAAFTGDLTHPLLLSDDAADSANQSWQKIRAMGVKTIYPGHGPVWQLDASQK
jgi:endoribonuclease LACTB2